MITTRAFIVFMIICGLLHLKVRAQALETDDAKPLDPGQIHLETTFGFETAADSKETAWNAEVKYRLSKRFMLSAAPTIISNIHPDSSASATGLGDIELILFLRLVEEKKVLPFMSVAMEAKIPTAQNELIGTGKFDFTPIFIANKTTGKFFTSVNLKYTFIGKPDSVVANNFFSYGIATIFTPVSKSMLFGEVYGNTSAIDPEKNPGRVFPQTTIQENSEFSGGETVFSVGYGYAFTNGWLLSFAVSYNNTNALLLGAGIEWESAKKKITNAVKHVKKTVEGKN